MWRRRDNPKPAASPRQLLGGFLIGTVLNLADVTGINISSIVVAVIGAIVVVAVYRLVMGRRTTV